MNNANRNLGSVLGVAVLGSLAAASYSRSMAAPLGVPHSAAALSRASIGAAALAIHHLQAVHAAAAARTLQAAAANAFVRGASLGAWGTAAVTAGTAAVTARLLPGSSTRPAPPPS